MSSQEDRRKSDPTSPLSAKEREELREKSSSARRYFREVLKTTKLDVIKPLE